MNPSPTDIEAGPDGAQIAVPGLEMRVWWIPQIPGTPFLYPVPSLDAGIALCDALAKYDLFQLEQRIKPDYSNAGGISYRHPVLTEGEWYDLEPEDVDEVAELRRELTALTPAN